MSPERYARVKELYFRASEMPGDDRDRFLDEAAAGDASLVQEVRSLLEHGAADTLSGQLLETDAHPGAAPTGFLQSVSWVGMRLGKYEVTRVLESGGMGAVLMAHDHTIQRRVAIKVLLPELARDESMRKRFLTEARAAGRINHPNVVTLYDVGEHQGLNFLVMEYAEEGSAADLLQRRGALGVDEATAIILQACRGVAAAHAAGLVHRDLKPANLLLRSDGVVLVSDFGIAKLADQQALGVTQSGLILGTPHYMSPEQCQGAKVDARSDVYSLGATYYSLLVGRRPFGDRGGLVSVIEAHCTAEPPDPRELAAATPDACAAIIRRAMAKAPADRYQSVDELFEDLTAIAAPGAPAGPAPRRVSRRSAVGGAAVAAAAGALGWAAWGRRGQHAGPAAAAAADAVRVGLLHSLTGTMASSEEVIIDACQLAIDEINRRGGVLGRRVEAVIADGGSVDAVFRSEALRLIQQQRVCTLFGCYTSGSRKEVKEVVEAHRHLLIYPDNHEGLETSPNIIYLGGGPSQTIIPCLRWAYDVGGYRSYFLVGSDYVFPRVSNEIAKDCLAEMGATVAGEAYLPLGDMNVAPIVDQIRAAAPDAIFNTISGDTQTAFVRRLRGAGVKATQFSTGLGEQELRSTPVSRPAGDYTASTYFQAIDTPANARFTKAFQTRFGAQRAINAPMEAAYAGLHLWAQAVEQCGGLSPLAIRDALVTQSYDAPSGRITIDPTTRYAYRYAYIGRAEPDSVLAVAWRSDDPIKPDPYPPSRTRSQWRTLLRQLNDRWDGAWSAPPPDA